MKAKKLILALALLFSIAPAAKADKGMWILSELQQQNIERMRELGFNLSIDSLYSLDKPSIANSVVIFGNGCTGVTVSNEGLVFTNHHCGYPNIQSLSSVEHDYLRDGFVSQSMAEELYAPGLQVRYLKAVENVTDKIVPQLSGISDEIERITKATELGEALVAEIQKDPFQEADVIPFYSNNEYFLIVYDVYRDVRLVFAPPSSVGKFGGDTDNWMWPRQTGDFSVFRVYAGADNKPAEYDPTNKPYQPKYYTRISADGYEQGDYAMTIGFPGSTDRYLTSWGIENRIKNENEPRIEVRGRKQAIWQEAMEADQATRIKYASKYSQSSNYWKNSIGMNKALVDLNVVANKQKEENEFRAWANKPANKAVYGNVLSEFESAYRDGAEGTRNLGYIYETMFGGTEIVRFAQMANLMFQKPEFTERVLGSLNYKDYEPELDRQVLAEMLDVVIERLPQDKQPDIIAKVINKKFKGDTKKYANWVFEKSVIPYQDKLIEATKLPAEKLAKLAEKDPAIQLMQSVLPVAVALQEAARPSSSLIAKNQRLYYAGRRLMAPEELLPSDANFTMRMSYGSVEPYSPKDGVMYNYYCTDRGILEKEDPNSSEFAVQPEILELIRNKDFGSYAKNGELPVTFLSTNDITGGNSGSPVFDKNGRLLGLAFDGNWEAMSGDIEFDPELQRTINVDVRYMLFMMDKWGKCPRLIDELTILSGNADKACTAACAATCGTEKVESTTKK